jgi:hypothetical protein
VHDLSEHAPAVLTAGRTPRTVAEALAAALTQHSAVIAAYTSSAGTALKVLAVLVLVVGVLIVAEMTWAAVRARRTLATEKLKGGERPMRRLLDQLLASATVAGVGRGSGWIGAITLTGDDITGLDVPPGPTKAPEPAVRCRSAAANSPTARRAESAIRRNGATALPPRTVVCAEYRLTSDIRLDL